MVWLMPSGKDMERLSQLTSIFGKALNHQLVVVFFLYFNLQQALLVGLGCFYGVQFL